MKSTSWPTTFDDAAHHTHEFFFFFFVSPPSVMYTHSQGRLHSYEALLPLQSEYHIIGWRSVYDLQRMENPFLESVTVTAGGGVW